MNKTTSADVLVIGAGTAGCVVATRLVQSGFKVILVEAGQDFGHAKENQWPDEITDGKFIGESTSFDWGYTAQLGSQTKRYLRGKVMGGSSAINASGINWGLKSDYDEWAASGLTQWSFDSLLPYFNKVENLIDLRDSDSVRASGGELSVSRLHSKQQYFKDFARNCEQDGFQYIDATGPESSQGYGFATRNVIDGKRQHPSQVYLDQVRTSEKLQILDQCDVNKILWQNDQATGIEVMHEGEKFIINAEDIILCAGSVGSPILLQRSGIGAYKIMQQLDLAASKTKIIPGVGKNLQDHFGIRFAFLPTPIAQENINWNESGSIRLRLKQDSQDIGHNLTVSTSLAAFAGNGERDINQSLLHFIIWLVRPTSFGNITINSLDPKKMPIINFNFGDEGDKDLSSLLYGLNWSTEFVSKEPMNSWIKKLAMPSSNLSQAQILEWIRDNLSFYYHMVGTCKMGIQNDEDAVVDDKGVVREFNNLHIFDASIMPRIPRGMLNLTVFAMAEKLVEGFINLKSKTP